MAKKAKQVASTPDANEAAMLRDVEIDQYLYDCVQIVPEAMEEEFVRLPADIAYWNEKYSLALKAYLLAKLTLDQTKALALLEIRELAASTGLKLTVGDIDARVTLDDRVQEAHLELVEADAERQTLRNRCDALAAKRDMLQSLGAKMRVEMMSDPVVREQIMSGKLT